MCLGKQLSLGAFLVKLQIPFGLIKILQKSPWAGAFMWQHCLGPFQPPGMEKTGQRAISIMQLFPAVPWRFLAQGHAGCFFADAHSGQRPEEVPAFSLQHLCPSLTMGILWPERWEGLVCLERPDRGKLLQALILSNVINENKSD